MQIKATLTKDPKLKKLLESLSVRTRERIFSKIAIALKDSTRARFFFSKDPQNQTWIPSKSAEKEGRRTLVKSGRLRDSVDANVNGNFIEVGIPQNTDYGRKFQLGIDGQEKREFLGISKADEKIIMKIIEKELKF